MDYTRAQFIRRVLLELGVVDATEAPAAQDYEDTEATMLQKFGELYEEGLLPFDIEGDVPSRYVLPLVPIVAIELVTTFGSPRANEIGTKASFGMKRLWQQRQKPYIYTPVRGTFY